MIALVVIGTIFDIIHKKNVNYFFQNAKKAKTCKNKIKPMKKSVILKTLLVKS